MLESIYLANVLVTLLMNSQHAVDRCMVSSFKNMVITVLVFNRRYK